MKGLNNFGNTCYFNSVLQCILQVPQLSNYMMVRNFESEFLKEYKTFTKKFWLDKENTVEDHSKILKLFRNEYKQFDNHDQHDCQETFIYLIEMFEKEIKDLIKEIFYFDLVQETVCKSEKSTKNETTNILMLSPEKNDQDLTEILKRSQSWNVLDNFIDKSGIQHHVATTRTLFWKPPRILTISINMYTGKYRTTLPEVLDLNDYIHPNSEHKEKENKYHLFGMCSHMGSLRGGHYISYTKHKDKWCLKDDTNCKVVEKPNLCQCFYIVFYKRGRS
jgi:ubiquitin C-terminal hydrolase